MRALQSRNAQIFASHDLGALIDMQSASVVNRGLRKKGLHSQQYSTQKRAQSQLTDLPPGSADLLAVPVPRKNRAERKNLQVITEKFGLLDGPQVRRLDQLRNNSGARITPRNQFDNLLGFGRNAPRFPNNSIESGGHIV